MMTIDVVFFFPAMSGMMAMSIVTKTKAGEEVILEMNANEYFQEDSGRFYDFLTATG